MPNLMEDIGTKIGAEFKKQRLRIQDLEATATELPEYEEGAWTPKIIGSGGGEMTVSLYRPAKYTRIGNQVIAHFGARPIVTNPSTLVGTIQIDGLPFVTSDANSAMQSVTVAFCNLFSFSAIDTDIHGLVFGGKILLCKGSSATQILAEEVEDLVDGYCAVSVTYAV